MISQKYHKISAKLQQLKDKIDSPDERISLLKTLQALEHVFIDEKDFFHVLRKLSISHQNNEIRYIAVRLLYKSFPEESLNLIRRLLLNDSNYNFRVISFSKQNRYNFNDIINWGIENRHNRELMIKNIINSDLLWLALSWKDYQNEFEILYDVNLNCFLLRVKGTNETSYICR